GDELLQEPSLAQARHGPLVEETVHLLQDGCRMTAHNVLASESWIHPSLCSPARFQSHFIEFLFCMIHSTAAPIFSGPFTSPAAMRSLSASSRCRARSIACSRLACSSPRRSSESMTMTRTAGLPEPTSWARVRGGLVFPSWVLMPPGQVTHFVS